MTRMTAPSPCRRAAPEHPNNILANVMAQVNWKNLRVAETEKYLMSLLLQRGLKSLPGEEREWHREVATYDLKPEMDAAGVRTR